MSTAPSTPIRLVIAEDSYLIRESLVSTLAEEETIEIVAVCSDRYALEKAIEEQDPAVVLTDIRMPPSGNEEGIHVAARLRESRPEIGVVVLSNYAEPAYALELLAAGSSRRAYLLKERIRNRGELVSAIEAVAEGRSVIDSQIVELLIQARSRTAVSPLSDLTARERELLAEIAQGKSNEAIAESLVLTKRAVEKHINSIFYKLQLPDAHHVSRRVTAALMFLADEGS